ncbi:hypothetical protein [Psychroserpens luteolus]|uniref:hypothetical protein n=1 Tax=Psychroserpens luteolus TaxID=2855840 RepID=UPI001E61DBF3|nr:hypothetical protein [Psychroserpens luteolus]MCD2260812.1 hypothetical protein [Psychroserpens luteolus]
MFLEILFGVLVTIGVGWIFYLFFSWETKSEKEQHERMKRSLEDAYIIDPETGAKLTLEQAESGHWEGSADEFRAMPEAEIKNLVYKDQQTAQRGLNHLIGSKRFLRQDMFSDEQFDVVERTITLSHYDDWSYSNVFQFEEGLIFLPAPETNSVGMVTESQLMMWLKIDSINGHYYFREKTKTETFFDKVRNDDELKYATYECFTFKTSRQMLQIKQIIDKLVTFNGLEIEIHNDNLFIKTLRLINKEDVLTFEKILSILYRDIKPFH